MSFLVDNSTRVMIQGVTGQMGKTVIGLMASGGFTPVVGVTPGRGGSNSEGVGVFDTVYEAKAETDATASLILVAPSGLKDAALEAINERMNPIVLMVDGVPLGVSLEIVEAAREAGVVLIGPNSPGIISPEKCLLGALDPRRFLRGNVAVISRSGGMMSTIAHTLSADGFGASTCLGIGGDSVIGLDMPSAVRLAQADDETEAIVLFGEIGTSQEERVATLIASGEITKPVVAYIAGIAAPQGIRYSHAGAQTDGLTGSALGKRKTLSEAGAEVVERYSDIPKVLRSLL
jgi:succinyl-CoA synthetase alpha subunit